MSPATEVAELFLPLPNNKLYLIEIIFKKYLTLDEKNPL